MLAGLAAVALTAATAAAPPASVPAQRDAAGDLAALTARFTAAVAAKDWPAAADALRRLLPIQERALGVDHPGTLSTLDALGGVLLIDGRAEEAEPVFRRALTARRRLEGDRTAGVARANNSLALALQQQRRYADAEPFYRAALAAYVAANGAVSAAAGEVHASLARNLALQGKEADAVGESRASLDATVASAGADSAAAADARDALGGFLSGAGRFADAVQERRLALATRERAPAGSPAAAGIVASRYGLGTALAQQGRYAEAEAVLRRALAERRAAAGAKDASATDILANLARTVQNGGDPAAAEPMMREVLATRETLAGPDDPATLDARTSLATVLDDLGRYAEAEAIARRAFEGRLRTRGETDVATAVAAGNLASTLASLGRDAEAEALYRRALAAMRATVGEAHPRTAGAYANLASILATEGRFAEAAELQRRALTIQQAILAPDHPDIADSFGNLGTMLSQQRAFDAADAPLRKALALTAARTGEDSLETARALNNLAANLDSLGRRDEAAPLYDRSLAIRTRRLGRAHPLTIVSLNNVAYSAWMRGDARRAARLFGEAAKVQRRIYGPDSPQRIVVLTNLATILSERRATQRAALADIREASGIASRRRAAILAGRAAGDDRAAQALVRARSDELLRDDPFVTAFVGMTQVDWAAAAQAPADTAPLRAEAFAAAQEIDLSQAGLAMARTAARTAAGGGALGSLVQRQQAATDRIVGLDAAYGTAVARGDGAGAARLNAQSAAAARDLSTLDAELATRFPNYRTLIAPAAVSLAEVQRRLRPGEGLLFVMPSNGDLFSFAVSHDRVAWHRAAKRQAGMEREVETLLCQLDEWTCAAPPAPASDAGQEDRQPFNRAAAYALYRDLIAPVEEALAGVTTLYVTTTGTLATLPLDLLATAPPPPGDDADPAVLARTPWLADRYALVSLPAVSMLHAVTRPPAAASVGFIGYGDPAIATAPLASAAPATARGLPVTTGRVFRAGGVGPAMADQVMLRSLAQLPGTRVELKEMAEALGAAFAASVRVGAADTETALKQDRLLPEARVVAFATHGLLPDELDRYDEPGLVFTPPVRPSALDDGVLAASEAAQLHLAADWVILSACNTAGAERGAESLSGLARAFLYAGAGSLLASHWHVADDTTAVLTVEALRADATLTRAAAVQAATRAVRTGRRADGSAVPGWRSDWAHPRLWAPFSLVADGNE